MDADVTPVPDPIDVLERVVHGLGDELASFRRRALEAERRVRELAAERAAALAATAPSARTREEDAMRIATLEAENADLRARLVDAAERARAVASRIRFARQQDDMAAAASEEPA